MKILSQDFVDNFQTRQYIFLLPSSFEGDMKRNFYSFIWKIVKIA